MSQDNLITVQIFNQTFRVSSEKEDPQYIEKAAAYLDQKMREAAAGGAHRPLDIAILAAMNIAAEVLEARQNTQGLLNEADQRISNFTRFLEDQTGSSPPSEEVGSDPPAPRF